MKRSMRSGEMSGVAPCSEATSAPSTQAKVSCCLKGFQTAFFHAF
ncbi:hypothetical protein [Neisseria meningitidis]